MVVMVALVVEESAVVMHCNCGSTGNNGTRGSGGKCSSPSS